MTTKMQQPRNSRTKKLCVLALLLLVPCALAVATWHWIVTPMILQKLEATVSAHLDALLTVGEITYRPPFTVHLYDVHFRAHPTQSGGGTELLAARRIDLSLAQLPLGRGPLVIQQFGLDGVTLHIIRNTAGIPLGLDLAKPSDAPASPMAMKLSDVLRLRHFSLKDGMLIYQDQRNPHTAPTRWQGINSEIALAPKSNSLYEFQLHASDAPIARANIQGTLDVDSFLLGITKCKVLVDSRDEQSSAASDPLPAELRGWVHRYAVKGTISLESAGSIPLNDPQKASFTADLGIAGGRATLPDGGEKLDDLQFATHLDFQTHDTAPKQVKIQLRKFRARSGGAILTLGAAVALIDPTGKWSVNGVSGSLDTTPGNHGPWGLTGQANFHVDLSHHPSSNQTPFTGAMNLIDVNLQPPGLAAPVKDLTGTIQFSASDPDDRQIDFLKCSAYFGGDHLELTHAQVSLAQSPDRILVNDIQCNLDLVQDAPPCPGDLGPILQTFQPSGPFNLTGTVVMRHVIRDDGPGYSPEWDLNISTDNGALSLVDERLPITAIKGHMLATKHAISIPGLEGTMLGGTMNFAGTARVVEPIVYQGQFTVRGSSVEQFSRAFKLKSPDGTEPSGVANLKFKFFSRALTPSTDTSATQPDSAASDEADEWLSLLGGDGSLQIDNGNLWALPVLHSLTGRTRVAREALTAGEAAAIFSVANRTIYFKHLAVYSPALGLQGSGSETFAGMLNLDVIAAPLGDWKEKLAETDIPFFSHALASAAGSIEKLVGSATSELLYHFRITGTRDNPKVETIPAPFLTDSAANLFAKMIHHDSNSKLVDAVNEK
jgi:hypothetical protein